MKTLRKIRVENNLTQQQLAAYFSVSTRTIYNVEKDSSNIKDSLLSKYLIAFNLKYDDIFLGDEYENNVFELKESERLDSMIITRLKVKKILI